ncbi:Glu/Leu/Phe/Val dehydrogenase dimerization domain-containing protein [Shewanella fidelis]|uniref:Glu/Leu/Phe/Val dehydrogenase n=1 Tax=Shewanella fidelis TaxID=173509 RepID=A0AAW8NPC3_9GAMM|nr:Glu/Leu/Phe/Val dehydrogenase dimerization domain-containing protein [Shewanella fidelis]MDR8524210.1 Glu/Leu/Phe/Val dehydrogenase [Shewanella fidelis]MDW4810758.1 Glu/Leu/Phe/Val dehydrogenase [Shewanella fidelis]MDW4814879.1 Glu/Leu/Phe/Val dehydrogenase [Shewanella fidelis]MDW4818969.1 Glu/Leu/Phe/Val dehydrogenase [Shewanella fidelis]MDW4823354.1 Glu/Leu/Phe/Val dehydrogenase [Shewanella fidelis]
MAIFNHISFDDHEQVVFCHDKESGLKAIIAIHNTNLGPAVGGCRMWNYESDDEAITDVLRLSRGMTYKNALAGLAMGGGKSVIIADPKVQDREALFRAFGRCIDTLGGKYYSAEDVGVSTADIMIAHQETPYMAGLEGKSGDPSPFTALGTYLGIKAAVKHQRGLDSLKGLKISVQGVGHVGYYLCRHLHAEGAELIVTDIHQDSLDRVATEFGATVVAPQDIYHQDVDVYAPCALGATINDITIPMLKATIVAGCANNQLAEVRHGEMLKDLGILYAPDYVINAGGIINVSFEKDYDASAATAKVEEIYNTLLTIFTQSVEQNRTTGDVADEMARNIINAAK